VAKKDVVILTSAGHHPVDFSSRQRRRTRLLGGSRRRCKSWLLSTIERTCGDRDEDEPICKVALLCQDCGGRRNFHDEHLVEGGGCLSTESDTLSLVEAGRAEAFLEKKPTAERIKPKKENGELSEWKR